MTNKHLQHLYWRAGFGINFQKLTELSKKSLSENVNILFKESKNVTLLKVDTSKFKAFSADYIKTDANQKRALQKENRKNSIDLNVAWVNRILQPKELLRERMTLFWANHFVCKAQQIIHIQDYNHILRKNALGNFKDFVHEVAKSASMIKYLNAKQNKKQSPNENFARELMELFTLGVGNYTEKDIKESAKAFTGWTHDAKGNFVLRKGQHDFEEKTFFGKTDNFNGEDIIDIIISQKQCATFICRKIYSYFVNEEINQTHINELVSVFFPSYDISKLMEHIFMADWFYNEKNIGTKIKEPIELLAGINQIVPITFENDKQLLYLQKMLGQQLLNPENVAGWKGGQNWIDTNTMMLRLKLPSLLLNNAVISLSGISEFEDTYEQFVKNKKNRKSYLKITADWEAFHNNINIEKTSEYQNLVLQGKLSPNAVQLLSEIKFSTPKEYCIQLMSLPEYQLC